MLSQADKVQGVIVLHLAFYFLSAGVDMIVISVLFTLQTCQSLNVTSGDKYN